MTTAYLGIDVSKDKLDYALLKGERIYHKTFGNSEKGFNSLHKWLKRYQVSRLHACMEASGSYWERLAEFLYQSGHRVSVVNPARTHAYSRSELKRSKTDKVDAGIIARFCRAQQPYSWKPLPPHKKRLRSLVRRRKALKNLLGQEVNRSKDAGRDEVEKNSIDKIIGVLKAEINRIEQQIKKHIARHSDLK